MTFAKIDVFNRGKIVAHAEHKLPAWKISKRVVKKDGKRPKPRSVQKTIRKAKLNPARKTHESANPLLCFSGNVAPAVVTVVTVEGRRGNYEENQGNRGIHRNIK